MTDQALRTDQPPSDAVKEHVTRLVERLQAGYLEERPWSSQSRRQLAELRRVTGAAGSVDPRMWGVILDGLPASLEVRDGDLSQPSRAESAILTALTTYAVHQQSQNRPMHRRGVRLGEATRSVARARAGVDAAGGLDSATVDRLHRISMGQTAELRAQSLRALVQLLRGAEQPLDYGHLAEDLYWLQVPGQSTKVHLAWGRGLHRLSTAERNEDTAQADPGPTTGEQS